MCIIIDTSTFGFVFDQKNKRHQDFASVLEWILYDKGKIVYGGSKYLKELKGAVAYLRLFTLFQQCHKIIQIDTDDVDKKENEYTQLINNCKFDDQHIVAIVSVSGCRIVCTDDKRAMPFIKKSTFYQKGRTPKIYSSLKNKCLLCDKNIPKQYRNGKKVPDDICKKMGFKRM